MPTAVAGPEIERLIQLLARLPGLGPRSARRAALHLIKKREPLMAPLAAALQTAIEKIEVCRTCGNIDTQNPCTVCTDPRRDPSIIVVVADVADLWALERAHAVNARYHVLGGTLSPLDGIGPQDLTIDALVSRAHEPAVKEVILALNATVDGQTTAHYITDLLHDADVKVTRLAHGVPVGGELDYLDEGTLSAAIRSARRSECERLACDLPRPRSLASLHGRQPRHVARPSTILLRAAAVIAAGAQARRDCDIAGLRKAPSSIRADAIVGTDGWHGWIVEVSCWRAAYNAGSILFAVPPEAREQGAAAEGSRPRTAGPSRDLRSHLPDYDPKTRTLNSSIQGPRRRRLRHDQGNGSGPALISG